MDWLLNTQFVQDLITLARPATYNLYFAFASIPLGFPFALLLALGKNSRNWIINRLSRGYIYAFRGSPLFVQFFLFYSIALSLNQAYLKPIGIDHIVLHPLFLGPLVLVLNTAAYSAEIFYGALKNVPRGEIEAAKAVGMSEKQTFRSVIWPNMIRLSWPSYTNEVIFLFHATAFVYFTLPVINEQKDLMNKAGELFEKDYALFTHYSAAALYFLVISLILFYISNVINRRLNKHLTQNVSKLKVRPNYVR